jgi:hypothetical protein
MVIACVLIPHTRVPHKEYRFVFCAAPLLLVLFADAIVSARSRPPSVRGKWAMAIVGVTFISGVGCAFGGVLKRDDRLLAALDLSRRSDVVALLDLSGPWWKSGGFFLSAPQCAVLFLGGDRRAPGHRRPPSSKPRHRICATSNSPRLPGVGTLQGQLRFWSR